MNLNVTYMETHHTAHIAVWVQAKQHQMPSGRYWYTYAPIALCGRREQFMAKKPKIITPDVGEVPTKPVCKVCIHVAGAVQGMTTYEGASSG